MDQEEFYRQLDGVLIEIPPEFRSFVSEYAWAEGHSSGYHEVLLIARELAAGLLNPILTYTDRIKPPKKGSVLIKNREGS